MENRGVAKMAGFLDQILKASREEKIGWEWRWYHSGGNQDNARTCCAVLVGRSITLLRGKL